MDSSFRNRLFWALLEVFEEHYSKVHPVRVDPINITAGDKVINKKRCLEDNDENKVLVSNRSLENKKHKQN